MHVTVWFPSVIFNFRLVAGTLASPVRRSFSCRFLLRRYQTLPKVSRVVFFSLWSLSLLQASGIWKYCALQQCWICYGFLRYWQRIERSLTSALQHHGSAANGEVSSDHTSKIDAPSASPASFTSSSKVVASSTICASVDRERMLQAVIQSRRSKKSQSLASQPEMEWNVHDDSDWVKMFWQSSRIPGTQYTS